MSWREVPHREVEAAPGTRPAAPADSWSRSGWLAGSRQQYTIDVSGRDYCTGTGDSRKCGLPKIYEVSVQARNDAGDTDAHTNWRGFERRVLVYNVFDGPYTLPPSLFAAPTVAATSTAGELSVSWSPPVKTGGANVHYYTVRHKVSTAGDSTYVTTDCAAGRHVADADGSDGRHGVHGAGEGAQRHRRKHLDGSHRHPPPARRNPLPEGEGMTGGVPAPRFRGTSFAGMTVAGRGDFTPTLALPLMGREN